ncbi:hypothetical protein GF380_03090 [Candidatus Uhrbacteria bacterium]|nr:hypothetical protein [Candidatus Uhrbacteria bacterium]MBD3284129.1 hypothetical protein [Candidatus Uhrbacteria bacterium]
MEQMQTPVGSNAEMIAHYCSVIPADGRHPNLCDIVNFLGLMRQTPRAHLEYATWQYASRLREAVARHQEQLEMCTHLLSTALTPDGSGLPEHQKRLLELAKDRNFLRGLTPQVAQELLHRAKLIRARGCC